MALLGSGQIKWPLPIRAFPKCPFPSGSIYIIVIPKMAEMVMMKITVEADTYHGKECI